MKKNLIKFLTMESCYVIISMLKQKLTKFLIFTEEKMDKDLEEFTRKQMHKCLTAVGIYPNSEGYRHLTDCVSMATKNGGKKVSVCHLYAEEAKNTNKKPCAVERAIRHSIGKGMEEGRFSALNDIFGYRVYSEKYPLRSGELIFHLASKILSDYENISKTEYR